MKATVKVIAAYLGSSLLLLLTNNLIPAFAAVKNIADRGTFRMMNILEVIIFLITLLVFRLLQKGEPEIRTLSDLINEEVKTGTALMVPGQQPGACYQPMTFSRQFLLLSGMCALQVLADSFSGESAVLSLEPDALAQFVIWGCLIAPIVEGVLHHGLLQRNLMKYGTVYAILFSGIAYSLFLRDMTLDGATTIFVLFYGFIAARYGIFWSVVFHIYHTFFQILSCCVNIRFVIPGHSFVYTTDYILSKIVNYGSLPSLAWIVYRSIKVFLKPEQALKQFARKVAIKADGTMTVLFFAGIGLMGNFVNSMTMLIYRMGF